MKGLFWGMSKEETNQKNVEETKEELDFIFILTALFVILKLFKVINWSWWWVFSPIWISIGLVAVLILIAIIAAVLCTWGEG